MSDHQESVIKHTKICILGGEKVGKTYLAHKLVDKQYLEHVPTTQCQQYLKNEQQKHEILTYFDFPPLHQRLAEQIPRQQKFDVMVCIFKDSTSFGQLYEFFESITIKSDENNKEFNYYWESIKLVVLVYSDYQQKGKVQLEQLFSILSQEIRNFNRLGTIKQFFLKSHLSNYQSLKDLIQNTKEAGQLSEDMTASQRQTQKDQEQLERRLRLTKSKRLSQSKDSILKSRDFSKSFNVQPQAPERDEEVNDYNEQYVEIKEVKQAPPKLQSESQIVSKQSLQQEKKQHNEEVKIKINEPQTQYIQEIQKDQAIIQKVDEPKIQQEQKRDNQAEIVKIDIQQKQNQHNQKEEHYQIRLEKVEEGQHAEQQEKPLKDNPPLQEQDQVNQPEPQIKKEQNNRNHGQPLPLPKSNYLQGGKKKTQKQPGKDSQSCTCIIM